MRLKVSRQEMPASTRILVRALATYAQFPRLPLASIETVTHMPESIRAPLWIASDFLVIRYLGVDRLFPASGLGAGVWKQELEPKTGNQGELATGNWRSWMPATVTVLHWHSHILHDLAST